METAAQLSRRVYQEIATVRAVVGPKLTVELATGTFEAKRAASCLLAPSTGDEVIVALPEDGGPLYVLSVLTRADEGAPSVLRADGDLEIDAADHLRFRATKGVEVRTPGHIKMAARELGLMTIDALVRSERLSFVGGAVKAQATALRSTFELLDTFAQRVSTHAKRSYRFIEEMDVTRADEIDTRAAHTMNMRGKNTFLTAEDLAKIDGEQVHLG